MGRAERNLGWFRLACSQVVLPLLLIPLCLSNEPIPFRPFVRPSAMATATLLSSSFAMPAAARRFSASSSASLGFATSQLAGLSLSAGAATPTAVALLPKRQQLQPIVARKSSIRLCCCFLVRLPPLLATNEASAFMVAPLSSESSAVSAVSFFFSASARN